MNWGVPTYFENDEQPGFVWAEIVDQRMQVEFYGASGEKLYDGVLIKD